MIEVVQAGTYTNKKQKRYRVQCWKCKAIFRFNDEDSICDPFGYKEYIECPQCHVMTERDKWIKNKKIKSKKTFMEACFGYKVEPKGSSHQETR